MDRLLDKPENVLQFSGGKDSLACLHLLRIDPGWDNLLVVWMNAGDPWPQTITQMREIATQVPHFCEVKADVMAHREVFGHPSDLISMVNTLQGQTFRGKTKITVQSWIQCCGANIWGPLDSFMREVIKPKRVYRGQRKEELYTSLIVSGAVVNGIEYILPLQDWTTKDVDKFLIENQIQIPEGYKFSDKSLDCLHCTAYLEERKAQMAWLKLQGGKVWKKVSGDLEEIKEVALEQLKNLDV